MEKKDIGLRIWISVCVDLCLWALADTQTLEYELKHLGFEMHKNENDESADLLLFVRRGCWKTKNFWRCYVVDYGVEEFKKDAGGWPIPFYRLTKKCDLNIFQRYEQFK